MSIAVRHHYIPVFYLKAWASNGLLWRYWKHEDGRVLGKEKPPSKVGFKRHLNTLHGSETPSALEDYLTGIDDKAAPVLASLRSGTSPGGLSNGKRRAFAKFVASLLERRPDRVRLREDVAEERLQELRASPKMGPMIDSLPPSLIEKHLDPLIVGRVGLKQIIEDPDWIDRFVGWRWSVANTHGNAATPLVTSDRPIVCLKEDNGYIHTIALAISPTQLFIAHPRKMEFEESDYLILLRLHNARIVTGGPEGVFSSTPLLDDSPQMGVFTLHYRKAMRMNLREAHWRQRPTP